jgi:hypothetical protein
MEHGLKLGSQRWLDANLGNDGGFHAAIVLHLSYVSMDGG